MSVPENSPTVAPTKLVYLIPESSLLSLILVSLGVVLFRLLKVPSDMSFTTGQHVDIISQNSVVSRKSLLKTHIQTVGDCLHIELYG